MSFTVKKMFQLALLALLIATPITFTYLNVRCDNLSKDIALALNKNLNKLTYNVLHLPENQTDAKSMSDLVTLVLSSRSLRSVAYFQNNNYIYSDRNADLHGTISPSLIERLKKEKLPLLYRKRSSLNKIDELHLVVKGRKGFYQLFINARYMDDWLTNADEYLRGYVVTENNNILINNKKDFLFHKSYHSAQFPFTVIVGAKPSQVLLGIGSLSAFIFILSMIIILIANYIQTKNFSFRKDIDRAIKNNEFIPYYQPIVCNKTHQIMGAELLCRWSYRHKQLISPNQFITKVESNGQIKPITLQLLKQLSVDKPLISQGNNDFYVSINVTLSMLSDPIFVNDVIALIKRNSTLQNGLVFEMTERENTTNAFIKLDKIMQRFRDLGVRWALDDFGTGYSSLSSLKELNFDIIKIDKLFVNSADTDAITSSILNNIASLGKELQCKLVAEGVETETQLNKLKSLSVDYTQGFYFSPPTTQNGFTSFQKEHDHKRLLTNKKINQRYVSLKYHGPIMDT
ncbi:MULTISPECIES: EAL domain-containing protein [unclassified Photobacterium]|uniref:EAL domain-containing protein n=1 Tax=unclassified Photobacterium TaxID=2628852 RepID=UPI001EDCC9C5|nr:MULTISPECIES: EAL domain-containing protein [unclassified Photobacterium]MCG3862562.1 EAL domain-containing protein [Photobacterium sp. Ph6]MCG3873939.1 EAL domain-containing protein [Photobacterium sp. Ph5]